MATLIECWICGKPHEYCSHCAAYHGWKYVADTPEHYQIYLTIEDYNDGVITKEEAKSYLNEIHGIKSSDDLSWMLPNVEKNIREIIGEKAAKEPKSTRKRNPTTKIK